VLQAEGVADGHHEIAHLDAGRIPQCYLDQALRRHLEHGHVGSHVAADHRGGQVPPVLEGDGDFRGVIHHMGICNDVPVLCIKDDAGACALKLPLARHIGDVEEPAEEGVLEQGILGRALADGSAGGDVHDRRRDALDHGRERRHRGFADGRWQGGVAGQCQGGGAGDERDTEISGACKHFDEDTQTMVKFLLWLLLLVFCWPLALLALVLWPVVWLLSIPFRLLGIAVDGVFSLLRAIVMLPARVLGGAR
jgi:hypothetical protein